MFSAYTITKATTVAFVAALAGFVLPATAASVSTRVASPRPSLPSNAQAASVRIGQLFAPNAGTCGNADLTILQLGAAGRTYVVPHAGVITSWSFQTGPAIVPDLTLKVARRSGGGYTIIGQAVAGTQAANAVNTYKARIPVKAGEVIGIFEGGGDCASTTNNPVDVIGVAGGDLSPGTAAVFTTGGEQKVPVSAKIATR